MASEGSVTSPNLSSRFSSLKVFKFASKDKELRPPPPPPKDEYYSRNRSMASLLPDNMSLAPNSPMSPQPQFQYGGPRSADANQSTMSLVSSAASGFSSAPAELRSRSGSRARDKAFGFLKFGKRSPRSPPSTESGEEIGTPGPDASISMPWNFQHNIHVDDGLKGMPPSWTTSLAAHGFSEEEIAMLLARRAESRSPGSQNLFSLRPQSPTIAHPYQPNNAPSSSAIPLVAIPAPRTTSLPRKYSDASLRSNTTNPVSRPPLPSSHSSASISTTSLHSNKTNSRLAPQRHPNSHSNHPSISMSSDSTHSSDGGNYIPPLPSDARTNTHTINRSIDAGGHSRSASASSKRTQPDTKTTTAPPPIPQLQPPLSMSTPSLPSNPKQTFTPSRRTAGTAPRLSISLHNHHASGDLSSWAGDFLEGLASGDLNGSFKPTSPKSAPASAALPVTPSHRTPPPPTRDPPQAPGQVPEPDSPVRLTPNMSLLPPRSHSLPRMQERDDDGQDAMASPPWTAELPSSSSPLWSQLEGILGQSVKKDAESDEEHGPYSAALAETHSPVLPFSPEEERSAAQRRMRTESRTREILAREEENDHRLSVNTMRPNRDSSRSSTSTISAAGGFGTTTTIVRNVSIARRAGAFVIDKNKARVSAGARARAPPAPPPTSSLPTLPTSSEEIVPPPSGIRVSLSLDDTYDGVLSPPTSANSLIPTPSTDGGIASHIDYYLQPSPDPSQVAFFPTSPVSPETPTIYGHARMGEHNSDQKEAPEAEEEADAESGNSLLVPPHITTTAPSPSRPTIVINDPPEVGVPNPLPSGTPLSPFQRYRGWLSEVVKPLEPFIDEVVDPRDHYLDLKEIAEGESGSVYSARLIYKDAHRLRLSPLVKAKDAEDIQSGREILVAIKSVTIVPSGSPKLNDLRHELNLMNGLCHENLISLDALYVDLIEDTLWIRMELMERSLADVVALVDSGLMLQDRTMARFASDILHGLDYLQQHNIAHRDIRSDNLLINKQGVLKITDFSSAVKVPTDDPMREDAAGVLYWQAPEMRSPPYNVLKIDVWSLGATVWEMSETQPPFADTNIFADRWPSVQQPEIHSPAFHDFLQLCSEPAATRPSAGELINSAFIKNACGRPVMVHLLSQCLAIEASFQD